MDQSTKDPSKQLQNYINIKGVAKDGTSTSINPARKNHGLRITSEDAFTNPLSSNSTRYKGSQNYTSARLTNKEAKDSYKAPGQEKMASITQKVSVVSSTREKKKIRDAAKQNKSKEVSSTHSLKLNL